MILTECSLSKSPLSVLSHSTALVMKERKENDGRNETRDLSLSSAPFPDTAEASDPEEKLLKLSRTLKDCLQEVSRQRLRALHMALRRFGNLDSRISEKDMMQVFQVCT